MESSLNIQYLLLLRAVSVAVLPRPVDGCEAGELQDAWQQPVPVQAVSGGQVRGPSHHYGNYGGGASQPPATTTTMKV